MKLEAGKLRPMQEFDLDRVLQWRNSDRIRANMFSDHIISEEEHLQWFKQLKKEQNAYLVFQFNDRPVGLVYFTDIDRYNNKCFWGFYLGETGLPQGAGLLMGYWGLEFVFNDLKIRKLCSEVFAFNTASIKYHKKLGFIEEVLLVKHREKAGQYVDTFIFSLSNDIWEVNKKGVEKSIINIKCKH
ncbi:MAG: hypothetical protein A4E53_02127 [Pelotomaculum sp. PtaB.Bin104]|nr:MAG: hypothetical protein A4E53_02127 [Pelotomaculum sp. PtaB.Bin104]